MNLPLQLPDSAPTAAPARQAASHPLVRALDEALRLLQSFGQDGTGLSVVDLDLPDQPLVYVNAAWLAMTGHPREAVIGRNPRFLQGDEHATQGAARAVLHEAIAQGRMCTVVLRNFRRDGTPYWCELSLVPLDEEGRPRFVIGLHRDVTRADRDAAFAERQDARRLREFDDAPDAVFLFQYGRIVHANKLGLLLAGVEDMERIRGDEVERFVDGPARIMVRSRLAEVLQGRRIGPIEIPCRRLDGTPFVVDVTASATTWKGAPAVQAFVRNVSERHEERALLEHERWALGLVARGADLKAVLRELCLALEKMLPDSLCAAMLVDDEGRLRAGAAPSLPDAYSDAIDGVAIGPRVGACGTAAWTGTQVLTGDVETDPEWEAFRPLLRAFGLRACWSTPFRRPDGRVGGTFAVYYRRPHLPSPSELRLLDVSTRLAEVALTQHLSRQELADLARRDDLTRLPNRRAIAQATMEAIALADEAGEQVGMLVIDLDGFKHVNDTLGHQAGDVLLREVAQRMNRQVKPPDLLGRRSGDEFVLLVRRADAARLESTARALLDALRQPFRAAGEEIFVSGSVGASLHPAHGRTDEELFRHADAAMYQAKAQGRHGYSLHAKHDDGGAPAVNRLLLESQLRHALERREFVLHYQPRFGADGGRMVALEALVRWAHPERGLVMPGQFIDFAEETGLIRPLGEWILQQACRDAAALEDGRSGGLRMSVNVSARQFTSSFFRETVPRALADSGLPARLLELEITESVMLDEPGEDVLDALRALRTRGVRVLLDDFGTGYSSLSYLHRFPLDGLKIDRSFVKRLPARDAVSITQAMVGMAHALDLCTVAEGVEEVEQERLVREMGCDEIQGFLRARPMPLADLRALLGQARPPAG